MRICSKPNLPARPGSTAKRYAPRTRSVSAIRHASSPRSAESSRAADACAGCRAAILAALSAGLGASRLAVRLERQARECRDVRGVQPGLLVHPDRRAMLDEAIGQNHGAQAQTPAVQ